MEMKELLNELKLHRSGKSQYDIEDLAWEATKLGLKLVVQGSKTLFYKENNLVFCLDSSNTNLEGDAI